MPLAWQGNNGMLILAFINVGKDGSVFVTALFINFVSYEDFYCNIMQGRIKLPPLKGIEQSAL